MSERKTLRLTNRQLSTLESVLQNHTRSLKDELQEREIREDSKVYEMVQDAIVENGEILAQIHGKLEDT